MDIENFGMIEMVISFGVVFAILFQQLISVKLQLRKSRREESMKAQATHEHL
jgi:hypothetical protein